MSSELTSLTSRWLAYDTHANATENMEMEPSNHLRVKVAWSQEVMGEHCEWTGYKATHQDEEWTNQAKLNPPSQESFRASQLPMRTLQVEHVPRLVYFLPHNFLAVHGPTVATAVATHRTETVAKLLTRLNEADKLTTNAYSRFRLIWCLARDHAPFQPLETIQQFTTTHTNLYAPIITHDHKSFVGQVMKKLMPGGTLSTATATSSSGHEPCGILPQIPFACDINDPVAMTHELLLTMIHAQLCRTNNWNLDARLWTTNMSNWLDQFKLDWDASVEVILGWLSHHILERMAFIEFVVRCYRELLPPKVLLQVMTTCFPFDWMDITFQNGLVKHIVDTKDHLLTSYPPALDYRLELWKLVCTEIESHGCLEVQNEIYAQIRTLTEQKAQVDSSKPAISHWTVSYNDSPIPTPATSLTSLSQLRTCTLRFEAGFSSTTGCSLWPAGMLMSEFIIANRHLFAGKRVLELGVGIGLTTILLHRAGVATLVCTDCDEKALNNLHTNFDINGVPVVHSKSESKKSESENDDQPFGVGVHIANLDWCNSSTRSVILKRTQPDFIIACDTIYLPELHQALGEVVLEGLKSSLVASSPSSIASPSSSSISHTQPCAYFAQMNRNPDTFAHYLSTFVQLGLTVTSQTSEVASLPSRFAYDRQAIEFHRFTLPNQTSS